MVEPMHQHEYALDLWEFERGMMSNEELLEWAQRGFINYLMGLPEDLLKTRYEAFESLLELSEQLAEKKQCAA